MDIKQFKKLPLMGILRGVSIEEIPFLVDAIVSSGLKTIEIAMNASGAPGVIKKAVRIANNRLMVGAGTVLTSDDLTKALDCGAAFIVSPTLVPEVVQYCAKNKIPVFPGALSPQEIYNAWTAGATMVKIFPAKLFGPSYFKEIKAPLKNIELLACGGVNSDNIRDYFSCGASAVAFGASIFKKEWISRGDFGRIEELIKSLVTAFKKGGNQ